MLKKKLFKKINKKKMKVIKKMKIIKNQPLKNNKALINRIMDKINKMRFFKIKFRTSPYKLKKYLQYNNPIIPR